MQRLLPLVCVALALVSSARAKPTITINGEVFTLAQEERYSDVTVREFLPARESYPKWNRMAVVRELYAIDDPKRHIESFAEKYRAENPGVKFELFQDKATGGWVIDCLGMSEEPGNGYAQWNVWRATKAKKGIVMREYAERLYFNESALEVKDALAKLRRDKASIVYAADFQQKEEPDGAPIAKPTIAIHGEVFTLFQETHDKNAVARLFFPDKEPSAKRSRTLTVSQPKLLQDTKAYINSCARIFQQDNPGQKFDLFQSEVTGDWVMDCVRRSQNPKERAVDWTVYRAHKSNEGIVLYIHVTRLSYNENAEEIANELAQLRAEMAPILYATSFCEREASRKQVPAPVRPASGATKPEAMASPPLDVASSPLTKPTIIVGREVFTQARQQQAKGEAMREFLLARESLERWSRLVAVRELTTIKNPKLYIDAMAEDYQKNNPGGKFDLFPGIITGAWIIDFLSSGTADSESRFVEWNVFRAQPAAQGIVVYQYAARLYFKESAAEIRDALAKLRAEMAPIVYAADFAEK